MQFHSVAPLKAATYETPQKNGMLSLAQLLCQPAIGLFLFRKDNSNTI